MIIQSMNDNANVSAGTAIEDIESKESKKKKFPFFKIFAIILILVVFAGLGFYLLKNKNLSLNNKKTPETTESSSEVSVPEESPFSNLVGENTITSETENGEEFLEQLTPPVRFIARNKFAGVVDDSKLEGNFNLEEGEAVLLVEKNGDEILYKIISSKSESLGNEEEELDGFNLKIDPKNIYVYDRSTGAYTRLDYLGFEYKIPDSLSDGDLIFLVCKSDSCKDGELSWALVF